MQETRRILATTTLILIVSASLSAVGILLARTPSEQLPQEIDEPIRTESLFASIEQQPQSILGDDLRSASAPDWFVIEGLVRNPLNLTYAELWGFPMVSETAMLKCVGTGEGQGGMNITYNWTGVPLFYLLSMAKVIPGDYREVVFYASDGFSSSITLHEAMNSTTILALEANGTDLEQLTGFGSSYRVALPCRWGYKWVKWIVQMSVVDYDYKGTYEQYGFSDEAFRENCTVPVTNPPNLTYNLTESGDHEIQVMTNSTVASFSYESERKLSFNVTGSPGTVGFFYITLPKQGFTGPYQPYVDMNPARFRQVETTSEAHLYFEYTPESGSAKIEIMRIQVNPLKTIVGQGYTVKVNVTVANSGNSTQNLNVTLNANMTSIASQSLLLGAEDSASIVFIWDTTDWDMGNYSMTATVTELPEEANSELLANKEICVTTTGDLDADFDVDLYDAVRLLLRYGSDENDSTYSPDCDIDGDGNIDLFDAVRLLANFGTKPD